MVTAAEALVTVAVGMEAAAAHNSEGVKSNLGCLEELRTAFVAERSRESQPVHVHLARKA